MKILLVADLHYSLPQWDWLNNTANRFDLVVIAGDLLDIASIVPLEAQIIIVRKYIGQLVDQTPLLISSGNHDILNTDDEDPRNAKWLQDKKGFDYAVDGDDHEQGDLYISILPWWESELQRAAIEAQLSAQQPKAEGKRWIWIYHPPPKGTTTAWNGRRDYGDEYLPTWIHQYKPEMVLSGHIHNAPFYGDGSWIDQVEDTWIFNSGKQTGGIPCFTVIDTEANSALWLSAAEGEQVALQSPLERKPLSTATD